MFIRFSAFSRVFRRSRRAKTQSTVSDTAPVSESVSPSSKAPITSSKPLPEDPFDTESIIDHSPTLQHPLQPSRSQTFSSSASESDSDSEPPIPIIVVEEDSKGSSVAFELVPTAVTSDDTQTETKMEINSRPKRGKSIRFSTPALKSSMSKSSTTSPAVSRRVTIAARATKRDTMVTTKKERLEKKLEELRQAKLDVKRESRMENKRTSKRVSSAPKKEKRQSRWEREINDPHTQEVLKAMSTLS